MTAVTVAGLKAVVTTLCLWLLLSVFLQGAAAQDFLTPDEDEEVLLPSLSASLTFNNPFSAVSVFSSIYAGYFYWCCMKLAVKATIYPDEIYQNT